MNLRERNEQGVLKIGVIDLYSNGKEDAIKPYPMQPHVTNAAWTNHADNIIKIIRKYVPNAIIYLVRHDQRGIDFLVEENCAIISMSLAGQNSSTMEAPLKGHGFLVCGAGNDGDRGESWSSRQEYWCAVGAVNSRYQPQNYSSYGHGVVETCAVSPMLDGKLMQGTSFTTPVIVGLLAQWYIWHFNKLECYPSVDETYAFIEKNSHDIFEDGIDLRTGKGLLRLPNQFKAEEVIVKAGNRLATKLYHVEGKETIEKTVDLLEVPFIKNDRTFVPSNGLTSSLGINVRWNNLRGTSHYIR